MDYNQQNNIPEEYRPISMWGYFGYELLFSIPCVGFILLLVFSFGGARNINLRNFARSYFCFLIIVAVLVVLLAATGALPAVFAMNRCPSPPPPEVSPKGSRVKS
ncbi:MAG: hypothetical protein K2I21_00500 [Acetatifactor sp.]|nr:hypothetical protein [Acetatifactor sp.]